MKKTLYSLAMVMITMFCAVVLTACGEAKAESIKIKANSVETTVVVGTEYDLSGLVLQVTYDDGEVKEVAKNDDMTITTIKMNQLGKQTLKVDYLNLTATLEVTVVATDSDLYQIFSYQKPEAFTLHESYKSNAGGDYKNAVNDERFAKNDGIYKVGDDNEFIFLPIVKVVNPANPTVHPTVEEYTSKVTVKQKQGNSFVELTGDELDAMVEIDNIHSKFDFTQAAADANAIFEITVQPEYMAANATYNPITFTIQVVDGWNVYDEANLSRIDNSTQTRDDQNGYVPSSTIWASYKQANNIGNEAISGIILHRDMVLDKSHVPAEYIHEANATNPGDGSPIGGSLKDSKSLYTRDVPNGQTFTIYGNYFSISTLNEDVGEKKAFPLVKYMTHDDSGVGHSALFSFGGDNHHMPTNSHLQGHVVLENLSLKGNGGQAESSTANAGGLTGIITSAKTTTLNNCLMRAFVTHVNASGYNNSTLITTTCNVNDTKLIDSYSSMFYAYSCKDSNINNSVMKNSGGPLVIATHVVDNGDDRSEGSIWNETYSNINVNNSIMDAPVGGSEAWFKNGAEEYMGTFRVFSGLMEDASSALKTGGVTSINATTGILKNNAFNFLVASIGRDIMSNKETLANTTTIKDANGDVINQQQMSDAMVAQFAGLLESNMHMDPDQLDLGSFPPVFKAGNTYLTLDLNKGEAGANDGLALICLDPTIMAQNIVGGNPNPFISLNGLTSTTLYQNNKAVLDAALADFFNASHVNVFLGGHHLGVTFSLFQQA